MGKRIEYIDHLKFFAIFCVLLGHSTEQISADLFWDHPVWTFIYSYHMPLFIFISGIFFRSSLKKNYLQLLKDRFIQLIIPSITAFLIVMVILKVLQVESLADLGECSFNGFLNSVWFLKCLFLCIMVMWPLCKLFSNDLCATGVALLLSLFLPYADVVCFNFMLPMFALGMVCGNHIETLEKHWKAMTILSCIAFVVLLPFWSGRMTVYMVPTRVIDLQNGGIDLNNLGLSIYRLCIGIAGTLTFFSLSKYVSAWIRTTRWSALLSKIGASTLGIYVIQTFTLEIFLNCQHIYVPVSKSFVVIPLIAIAELILCYGLTCLFDRNKVTRLLILGKR